MDPSEALYLQLQVLGFPDYLNMEGKSKQYRFLANIHFSPEMFSKANKVAFQAVYAFLFKRGASKSVIGPRWEKESKACFPSLDVGQETDFRKLVIAFLTETIEKDSDFRSGDKIPYNSVLLTPGGSQFVQLTLKVVTFVMTKMLTQQARNVVRDTKPDEVESKINSVLVKKSQREHNLKLKQENIHCSVAPVREQLVQLLAARIELKKSLEKSRQQFAMSVGSDISSLTSNDFLDKLNTLQTNLSKKRQSLSLDVTRKTFKSDHKGSNIVLVLALQNCLDVHKSFTRGTAKVNAGDLQKVILSNRREEMFVNKLSREVRDLIGILKTAHENVVKEQTKVEEKLLNHPHFKRDIEEVMKTIGITRPIPVITFRPLKPTSEAQTQRWRQLIQPRQESRVTFSPSPFVSADTSAKDMNRTNVSPDDISFNVSALDHSMFGGPSGYTRSTMSLGLLNIPESDDDQ